MKKTFEKIFSVVLFASIFSFNSCEIGLGESVDIIGPTVNITDPAPRENVMSIFDISGTVSDDFEVENLSVTCGGNEWKNVGGKWSVKKEGTSDFITDSVSEWIVQDGGKSITWKVKNVDFTNKDDGDYEIVASAVDTSGNTSGESKKTRTVVVDKKAPVITVSEPVIKKDSEYFTNITDYKDITVVSNFVTGDFTISGSTTDENTINYIDVLIKSIDNETTYYEVRLAQDINNIPKSYTSEQYKIVDSLRAWETEVKLNACNLKNLDDNKNVLKIVTKTADSSGNEEIKSHGYFCLWKTAAYPWIEVNLGSSVSPLSVYVGSKILGNAYDDTAVKEIYATVKKGSASGAIVDGYNKKSIYKGTEENNVFFNLEVPQDCEKYYVKFETVDIYNKPSTAIEGYIKVEDKTFPYVDIKHKVDNKEKTNSETLFGNKDGNFTFVLNATDDTKVSSLKIAYMTNDTAIVDYSDKSYSGWSVIGNTASDLKEGKALVITLTEDGIDSVTKMKKYKAELPINIFTDLGIDGSIGHRLSNQTFVFRVEDENENAITKDYTILGDIEAPGIKFENIKYGENIYTQNANGQAVCNGKVYNYGIPAFTSTSSITVKGLISDDSINAWGLSALYQKWNSSNEKIFTLECNGTEIKPTIDFSNTTIVGGKKWYSFEGKVENNSAGTSLKGSSLVYKAVLRDFNNNEITQTYAFLVDTQTLKVEYIYTTKSDGCYGNQENGTDTVIPIIIRFNKSLRFSGTTNPQIRLNNDTDDNKKYYSMSSVSPDGAREFVFNYKVKEGGNDVERLDVKEFKLNGGTISDSNGDVTTEAVNLITKALSSTSDINLKNKKKITIIKTPLKIQTNGITVTENESEGTTTVQIEYTKDIKAGIGEVTIKQKDDDLKIPPVLSKNEYNSLPSTFNQYYEYGTNGASSSFVRDLSPKYILRYENSVSDPTLVESYKATGSHIRAAGIKSYKTVIDGKKVTMTFSSLPCKGAVYDVNIPEGLVVDAVGGSKFPAEAGSKEYTAEGIEIPVIRILKKDTEVQNDFTAKQPLTAKFKIDCETPNVTLTARYVQYDRKNSSNWANDNNSGNNITRGTDEEGVENTVEDVTEEVSIGDESNKYYGQTFNITVKASVAGKDDVYGYETAQRTVIRINNSASKMDFRVDNLIQDKDYDGDGEMEWPGQTETGNNKNSKKLGLFLKGGDNEAGPNTVAGLPATWDLNEPEKSILFTEADSGFYIVSWKITCDNFYFMVSAGLMDENSKTSKGAKGPLYSINAQNRWVGYYKKYPVQPGEYLDIENTNTSGQVTFEVNDKGKAKKVR